MKKAVSVRSSLSTFSLLGILFVALKLTDKINWNWLWVLAPFWVPLAVGLVALLIVGAYIGVKGLTDVLK